MSVLKIQYISDPEHRFPLGTIINAQALGKKWGSDDGKKPFSYVEIDTEIRKTDLLDNRFFVDIETSKLVDVVRSEWKSVIAEEAEILLKMRGLE